jgi:hypothetical protein
MINDVRAERDSLALGYDELKLRYEQLEADHAALSESREWWKQRYLQSVRERDATELIEKQSSNDGSNK